MTAGARDIVFQESTTVTASGTGSEVLLPKQPTWMQVQLDWTNADTSTSDNLHVFIQTKIDDSNWFDCISFTQVSGTASPKKSISKIEAQAAQAEFDISATLSFGSARHIMSTIYRMRWNVVNDTAPSFTFSVTAILGFK